MTAACWIKSWSRIMPDTKYLVLAANLDARGREWFSNPQVLPGWRVLQLFEGAYVAQEIQLPASIKECL